MLVVNSPVKDSSIRETAKMLTTRNLSPLVVEQTVETSEWYRLLKTVLSPETKTVLLNLKSLKKNDLGSVNESIN